MSPAVRFFKALRLFGVAGLVVCCGMLATAAVGVVVGSGGPRMPFLFVALFWAACAVFGAPCGWLVWFVERDGEQR